MTDRYLQAPLIERPAGNATAICVVDPTAFHNEKDICADCDYLIPAGALVFREEEPAQQPMNGLISKKMRRAGFSCKVISNFGTPHDRKKIGKELRFLGVAIDGVCDTRAAKNNPEVSGRFTISMSGTVSIMLTDKCLDKTNVGDLVAISDEVAQPHRHHRVPADFKIPVLKKADPIDDPEDAARRIVTKKMKADGLEEYIGDWRDVLYDPDYASNAKISDKEKRKLLNGYLMKAPRPLPGSVLWTQDLERAEFSKGSGDGKSDKNPLLSWNDLKDDPDLATKLIEYAKDLPADKARRKAMGILDSEDLPIHGGGGGLAEIDTSAFEEYEAYAIGKLLEKGEGYARIRLFPQVEVMVKMV